MSYLRIFKLQLISALFPWRSHTEARKIILHQSRRVAGLHALLHITPLTGCIVLFSLNFTNYYVGQNFDGAVGLQFVVKIHELLMQASMGDIVVFIINIQTTSAYIPLGALSVVVQRYQLAYLWSLDFASAIRSPTFSLGSKIGFICMVIAVSTLGVLVGPSSAVLMIPRLASVVDVGQIMWHKKVDHDKMFSSHPNLGNSFQQ